MSWTEPMKSTTMIVLAHPRGAVLRAIESATTQPVSSRATVAAAIPSVVTIRSGRALKLTRPSMPSATSLRSGYFVSPLLAAGPIVGQPDLAEPDEGPQAPDESHPLGQALQGIDHPAIHQAEVARVARDVDLADGLQEPIEERIGGTLEEMFLSPRPDGIDDLVARIPEPDEVAEQLGRVLQVGVHHHDGPPPRVVDAGRDGRLVAEIAGQVERHDPRVARCQGVEQTGRRIAAAVIDEDDLGRDAEVIDRGGDAAVQLGDVLLLVEEGDDDADLGQGRGVASGRSSPLRGDRGRNLPRDLAAEKVRFAAVARILGEAERNEVDTPAEFFR